MIVYCTSTTRRYEDIKRYVEKYTLEHDVKTLAVFEPPHLCSYEQLAWADELLSMNANVADDFQIVVASVLEIPILRILRRIREFHECVDNAIKPNVTDSSFVVHCLTTPEPNKNSMRVLHVDLTGEFRDRWPEGFFEERIEELF